jgi:hypothetical protein
MEDLDSGRLGRWAIVRTCFIVTPHCGQAGAVGLGFDMGKRPIKVIDG